MGTSTENATPEVTDMQLLCGTFAHAATLIIPNVSIIYHILTK